MRRQITYAALLAVLFITVAPTFGDGRKKTSEKSIAGVDPKQVLEAVVHMASERDYILLKIDDIKGTVAVFDRERQVSLAVKIEQVAVGQSRVNVEATVPSTAAWETEKVDLAMRVFFVLLRAELGSVQATPQAQARLVQIEDFGALRKSFVGRNIEARLALPAWVGPDGAMEFPPGHNLKPGELATITDVVLCYEYPAESKTLWGEATCGHQSALGKHVLVFLMNGATPRPKSPETTASKDKWSTFAEAMDNLVCSFGGYLDCIEANQRKQIRRQEAAVTALEKSERERAFREAGPEIVIWLTPVPRNAPDAQMILRQQIYQAFEKLVRFAGANANP